MDITGRILLGLTLFALGVAAASLVAAEPSADPSHASGHARDGVQLGPRPFYLVKGMDEGALKSKLLQCQSGPFYRTDFSIAHRGHCSFPNTQKSPMKRAHAWAPASSSAM